MTKTLIELYDLPDPFIAFILHRPGCGIFYTNQAGGSATVHPEIEGVLIPLPRNSMKGSYDDRNEKLLHVATVASGIDLQHALLQEPPHQKQMLDDVVTRLREAQAYKPTLHDALYDFCQTLGPGSHDTPASLVERVSAFLVHHDLETTFEPLLPSEYAEPAHPDDYSVRVYEAWVPVRVRAQKSRNPLLGTLAHQRGVLTYVNSD